MKRKLTVLLLALALALSLPAAAAPAFADVPSDAYYAQAVNWAVEQGITAGTSDTAFSPDQTCTRGQIITFLWRAAGSPAPAAWEGVQDISQNDYFYRAVLWAKEKGLFEGDTFRPNDPCTRLAAVEFIWKLYVPANAAALDLPAAGFSDIESPAVDWAVARGFVNGTSETAFSPDQTCTRGQIVTLLYRDNTLAPYGSYVHENQLYRLELGEDRKFQFILQSPGDDRESAGTPVLQGTLMTSARYWSWADIKVSLYRDFVIVELSGSLAESKPLLSGKYIRQAD